MMISWVRRRMAKAKHMEDSIRLAEWGSPELASLSVTLVRRFLRGMWLRLRLKRSSGWILCEKGVRIYHARHVSSGAALNLEEGCEIVGLSKRGIVFGDRCTIGRFATIRPTNVLFAEPGDGMVMGDRSNIGAYSYVGCSGFVEIGNHVLMGPRVNILAENHLFTRTDIPIQAQGVERKPIRIEDDCWIGAGATLLAGVVIGRGSVVAAGAVVSRDVPPGSVVAGIPARVIRQRSPADA